MAILREAGWRAAKGRSSGQQLAPASGACSRSNTSSSPTSAVSLEAAPVEGEGAAVALAGARGQHRDSGLATEILDDQVERGSAKASSLVTLVNVELPEEVRNLLGTSDLVGDHHEPDPRVFDINRRVQRASVRVSAASPTNRRRC